jgi:hypothetical protein
VKKLFWMMIWLAAVSACSSVPASTPELFQPTSTAPVQNHSLDTVTQGLVPTPTPELLQPTPLARVQYHPLDTITQIEEIDLVLAAVASGDVQAVRNLFGFSTVACKTVNALGGPPACREGEVEGTMVDVLPFLGPEGGYLRRDEVTNFPGLNVTGVYAIYQVSATAYSEENFPKGDYGIMLAGPDNLPNVVLQIKNRQIVRIDYVFDPASINLVLQRDASKFILSLISK